VAAFDAKAAAIAGSAETEEGPAPRRRGAATANLAELNDELGRLLVLLNGADEAPTTQQQAGFAELARRLDGALAAGPSCADASSSASTIGCGARRWRRWRRNRGARRSRGWPRAGNSRAIAGLGRPGRLARPDPDHPLPEIRGCPGLGRSGWTLLPARPTEPGGQDLSQALHRTSTGDAGASRRRR